MKDFLEKIKSNSKDGEEVNPQKTIVFFAFYVVFFIVVFCVIFLGGKKDYLKQEYEPGNNVYEPGIGNTNFVFDYKVTLNGVLHDYYGKRYGNVEAFKYNNFDYYFDGEQFLVNKDTWIKTDNPYVYYEFLNLEKISLLLQNITYMNEKELDNGDVELYYLVSSNTINQDLYGNNTDYVAKNFYSMYMVFLSRYLAIIPYLINKRLSKGKKEQIKIKKNLNEKEVNYIYHKNKNLLTKSIIISTLRVSLFELVAEYIICIFYFLMINQKFFHIIHYK